jgi:hypothetical protein
MHARAQAASKALENGHKKESLKEAFTALMTADATAVRIYVGPQIACRRCVRSPPCMACGHAQHHWVAKTLMADAGEPNLHVSSPRKAPGLYAPVRALMWADIKGRCEGVPKQARCLIRWRRP